MFNCPICGKAIGCPTRGKTKKGVPPLAKVDSD